MKVLFFSQDGTSVEQLTLALRLRWPDLAPLVASQRDRALLAVEQEEPDFVILCDDLPNLGIWSAIREIRRFSDVPIIVATASEGESEMQIVKGLELGADDYIGMPCNLMVMLARIVAIMRRKGLAKQRSGENTLTCGELTIDQANYEAYLGSERLALTPTEFRLLCLLAKNRHMTLTHEFIQRVIWGDDIRVGGTLKKYIQRLRQRLGDDARNPRWIKTVHGIGYRFNVPTAGVSDLVGIAAAG